MKRLFELAALLCLLSAVCWAQDSPSDLSLRFLYPIGRVYESDAVVPLTFEVTNNSTRVQRLHPSWSLSLPFPAEMVGLQLKPRETRRFPIILPPDTAGRLYNLSLNDKPYTVELQANSQTHVVGVLSPGLDKFDYLRSLKLEVDLEAWRTATHNQSSVDPSKSPPKPNWVALTNLANMEAELLPEHWAPLASLDTLIVYDLPSLNLNQAQKQALLNWCFLGGRLVLVSNGDPNEYRGTPFEPYLPMAPSEVALGNGLTQLTGSLRSQTSTLESYQGRPLLLGRPAVDGHLFLITAPLKELTPLSTEQAESLWRKVLPTTELTPPFQYVPKNPAANHLSDIPELPRPQPGWLALYLLAYALIVGPLNLGILRKKDKMLWSFVTVPVIAFAFAGGAYLLNLSNRSSVPVLRELGILRLQSGATLGRAQSEALFFSPSARHYTLEGDATTLCLPDRYGSSESAFGLYRPLPGGGLASVLRLSTWDIYALDTVSLMKAAGPITGSWKSGTLTLDSAYESAPAGALLYRRGSGVSEPFTLKKGQQSHTLSFDSLATGNLFSTLASPNKAYPGREELLLSLSNQAADGFQEKATYLLFWTDQFHAKLDAGDGTAHKSDYLVIVELDG